MKLKDMIAKLQELEKNVGGDIEVWYLEDRTYPRAIDQIRELDELETEDFNREMDYEGNDKETKVIVIE